MYPRQSWPNLIEGERGELDDGRNAGHREIAELPAASVGSLSSDDGVDHGMTMVDWVVEEIPRIGG